MFEDRFWNTNEYISTAKFAVPDGAMTMRRAGHIFRLDPAPPKVEDINDYIVSAVRENDLIYFTYFLHHYEPRLNKRVYRFLLTEGIDRYDPLRFLDYKLSCVLAMLVCLQNYVPDKGADFLTYVLKNVNLKFKIGEKLAIVGMNGSGKTTFIKLLCRLYDPTEGEILLNGVNIQKYDYDEYMSVFSVVFQDFSLFSFKIGEVVASSKTFDENKVRECLVKANFGDRLHEMPEGIHTYLYKGYDQSGIEISGGEAQKIALARALYKDSPFILLDEPTAALDPISEYEVYSNFNAISGDKTTVYISHRLASCRFCNKIVVFDDGKIVQHGSHEELLSDVNGKYHELWNAQAQYYTT